MRRMRCVRVALMVCMCAGVPAAALADGFVIPFVGINFGGDAGRNFGDSFDEAFDDGSRLTWGVRAGGMMNGVIGAEVDFSRSNNFFGDFGALGDNSVTTVMGSVLVGIPVGGQRGLGIRPYVAGGLGLIRRDIDVTGLDGVESNKFGYNVGGGVMGFFGTHFGITGDYRYFRTLDDDELEGLPVPLSLGNFSYSRATIGAVFRF